jgi:ankyrin repeat protein
MSLSEADMQRLVMLMTDQIKSMVQQAMQQRGPTKAADHHETVSQPTATCNPTEKAPNMTARQLNTTNDTASRALRAASSQFHLANDNVFSIARWVAAWQRTLKQYEAGPEMERLYWLMSLQSKTSIHRITSACSSCCLLPSFIITSLTCTVKEKERQIGNRESKMAGSDLGQLLLDATEAGDASQVRSLIDHNANVNHCNYCNTPLHLACQHGHVEVACMLINRNANVNQCDIYNITPLHLACLNGHGEVACMLIDHNANVNQCTNYNITPLHYACQHGLVEVACMLIDHNANVNQCNYNNDTPLHYACMNGHGKVACMLIDHNANVNQCNNNNDTPLHYACQHGLVEVACMLIDHNANVNHGNKYNDTPLHEACKYGHVEVACMLIDLGADFNIINVCCLDSVTD